MEYSQEALVAWRNDMLAVGRATGAPNKKNAEKLIDKVYAERGLKSPKHKIWTVSPQAGLAKVNELHGTKSQWYAPICGAFEVYWLGHWAFIKNELKLESEADPFPHLELCREGGGWFWPFENVVVMSERPSVLKLDDEGRLHCENGPAVSWEDGCEFYFWHGVSVPAEWINTPNDKLDFNLALTWENIEQRRCLAEIIGWEKVIEQLNPRVIDKDDPEIGTLLEVDLPDSGKERFLKVRCGTGRTFVLCVDRQSKTALEANASTYGLKPEELNVEVRT